MSHTKNGYLENYLVFSKTKYIHNNIQQNKIFCKKFQFNYIIEQKIDLIKQVYGLFMVPPNSAKYHIA